MEKFEKIQQIEAQKTPKGSLLGSFFSWGNNPEPKKPSLKQELRQIISAIEEENIIEDVDEGISLIKCEFAIVRGKAKIYQQIHGIKETIEFRYQGLHINYKHFNNQHLVNFNVAAIELLSIGSNGGEVTKFLHVSDPNKDYLDCKINFVKKGNDLLLFAEINAVNKLYIIEINNFLLSANCHIPTYKFLRELHNFFDNSSNKCICV